MNSENIIFGRHPVIEAIKSDTVIEKVYVKRGIQRRFLLRLKDLLKDTGTIITYVDESVLNRLSHGGNHQGVLAKISYREYDSVEDILQSAWDKKEDPFILVLNEVQDPHNLGSLIRSACGAGVHGIIIPKRRSAHLSATVSKVSAGADRYMKIAMVTNIGNTLLDLKEYGVKIIGTDADAEKSCFEYNFDGPIAVVMGGEDKGLGVRVKNICDDLIKIPLKGKIPSLNVGVAGAVVLFTIAHYKDEEK